MASHCRLVDNETMACAQNGVIEFASVSLLNPTDTKITWQMIPRIKLQVLLTDSMIIDLGRAMCKPTRPHSFKHAENTLLPSCERLEDLRWALVRAGRLKICSYTCLRL